MKSKKNFVFIFLNLFSFLKIRYHVAHSFFFSGGCVYILLFDISLDSDKIISENKLLYWFHFLYTQIGEEAT
jgi:hypothetical protein